MHHGFVGFQGDFTFNSNVVTFTSPFVQAAGLTATNWNVSANILGTGTTKTLRISAFSNDITPMNGSGTLFELLHAQGEQHRGGDEPIELGCITE